MTLETVVKRTFFSLFYGWLMNRSSSRSKIGPFIEKFNLSAEEFEESPGDFKTFNAFFSRKLKPNSRPIRQEEDVVVFPADGRHLGVPVIDQAEGLYVKGQKMDLVQLLEDSDLAERYASGTMVISRLCPIDYHRFHFPISGQTTPPRAILGDLYSVNPIALRRNLGYLLSNRRYVTEISSAHFGPVLIVEIGATCVGRVVHTIQGSARVDKGMEKGFFLFGGSCVITLFKPGRVTLAKDLSEQGARGYEVYAKMGDEMARKSQ